MLETQQAFAKDGLLRQSMPARHCLSIVCPLYRISVGRMKIVRVAARSKPTQSGLFSTLIILTVNPKMGRSSSWRRLFLHLGFRCFYERDPRLSERFLSIWKSVSSLLARVVVCFFELDSDRHIQCSHDGRLTCYKMDRLEQEYGMLKIAGSLRCNEGETEVRECRKLPTQRRCE